jgi:hypothetical protein
MSVKFASSTADTYTVRASAILGAINWCTAVVNTVNLLRVCVLERINARSDCGFREAQCLLQADQKSSKHAVHNCTLPTAMLWCTAVRNTVNVLRVCVLERNNARSDCGFREAQCLLQADQKSSTHAVYNCTLLTEMLWCTAAVNTVPVLRVGVLERNNAHSYYALPKGKYLLPPDPTT